LGEGGHRVLDVAVALTVGPKEFTAFFESALAEMPSIEIKLHSLQSNEDTSEVLSGKYHACILPRETRPERKLDVRPLFRERFVLGCSANHPLAAGEIVRGEDLLTFPFVDRLKCEFRDQILDHFARRDLPMQPRFRSDREDWVQRVVADGSPIRVELNYDVKSFGAMETIRTAYWITPEAHCDKRRNDGQNKRQCVWPSN
jgi:DNA-binding transcriptional LysR family regulator